MKTPSMEKQPLKRLEDLTEDQVRFLAVVHAFEHPISIDLVGRLSPLSPGPLVELLETGTTHNWITKLKDNHLALAPGLPNDILDHLSAINTPSRLSQITDQMTGKELVSLEDTKALIQMLKRSGRFCKAGQLEIQLARQAFENSFYEKGQVHLEQAVKILEPICRQDKAATLYISATLKWSHSAINNGKGLLDVERHLNLAIEVTEKQADMRSRAIINLHLGVIYYLTDRKDEALGFLTIGIDMIEELGDKGMRSQSAVFRGLYFFILGRYHDAFIHLEKSFWVSNTDNKFLANISTIPYFFGYCAMYLGKFHQAIGHLDYYNHKAMDRSDKTSSSIMRSILGTVLVLLKKDKEAKAHFEKAYKDVVSTNNTLGRFFYEGGMALYHFLKGNFEKAHVMLSKAFDGITKAGLTRQFASPWIVEMIYEFDKRGYDPIPTMELEDVTKRIMKGVNCHLQGVCLRLKAKSLTGKKGSHIKAMKYLKYSKEKLKLSGDPVQTSKTLLEMARLKLVLGQRKQARRFANEARQTLGGYIQEFFPDEFSQMVESKAVFQDKGFNEEDFFDRYFKMIESFYPSENRMEILSKMLSATSQMFGAERCGLFWFENGKHTPTPELRSGLNLSKERIEASTFKKSLKLVFKAFRENHPVTKGLALKESSLGKQFVRSVLCIPIEVQSKVHGVLYYDNSYLENAFEFLNPTLLKRMARHTNIIADRYMDHINIKDKATMLSSESNVLLVGKQDKIIAQSKEMKKLLAQIDRVAKVESTVLILGETGTGKELIAKRIHEKSLKNNGPFIIMDSTTIPKTLMESEMFGHEKGSFTGANRRKIGCIEKADKGSLFIDEIGELSLSAQAKLLRTLQEKTIQRVGGGSSISLNFRLIAATNRHLEKEVKEGRFREDLFYRLNVIPFELPPLRNRGKDPILLSRYFIGEYVKKYNLIPPELTEKNESEIMDYRWPGNVRELKNIIERAVLMSDEYKFELNIQPGASPSNSDPFKDMPPHERNPTPVYQLYSV